MRNNIVVKTDIKPEIKPFDFKHFEKLVNHIFSNVWNIPKSEKYKYETDS